LGAVTLEVRKQAETPGQVVLRFDVTDTGIGIDRGSQDHLFNSFTQADGSATRKFGGTGLGLAISKRLVELMGGEIWVRSEPGKGSVFSFTARFEKRDEEATARDTVSLAGMRALVLAAEPALSRFIRRELTRLGAVAEAAATPIDVIEKLRYAAQADVAFDFVFIDAGPVVTGYALAREIKRDTDISGTNLVLLSPLRPAVSEDEWRAAGFSNCVAKPIWESKLVSCLKGPSEGSGAETRSGEVTASANRDSRLHPEISSSLSIRQRILIAEDSPINQKVTRRQLQSLGYDADVVENGVEALEAAKTSRYDCILMDCQMPVMDGFAATGELRRLEGESRHTPVIALTASAMSSDRDRCLEAGMDDFIPKPTRQAELASVLRKWIAP
ncbi:MAG: response regulator, partial [Blastocatellia bacterium]